MIKKKSCGVVSHFLCEHIFKSKAYYTTIEDSTRRKKAGVDRATFLNCLFLLCAPVDRCSGHRHHTCKQEMLINTNPTNPRKKRRDHIPVRADSRIPNGFTRLRNASTLFVLAVNSTMTLFPLTSTILAPNWFARVWIDCKCWCFTLRASLGVRATRSTSAAAACCCPLASAGLPPCSKFSTRWDSCSRSCSPPSLRGSWEGPPRSCSSTYSGPRIDTLTSSSSREMVRVSV
jgi:hypothetical protein